MTLTQRVGFILYLHCRYPKTSEADKVESHVFHGVNRHHSGLMMQKTRIAMFCSQCGKPVADGAAFCSNCGAPMQPAQPAQPAQQPITPPQQPVYTRPQGGYNPQPQQPMYAPTPKSKIAAILLAFFLGCWGVHRLYLNENKTLGIIMLVLGFLGFILFITLIITAIIALVDIIRYAVMSDAEFNTRFNTPQ